MSDKDEFERMAQAFVDGAVMLVMSDERISIDERLEHVAWMLGETETAPRIVVEWESLQEEAS